MSSKRSCCGFEGQQHPPRICSDMICSNCHMIDWRETNKNAVLYTLYVFLALFIFYIIYRWLLGSYFDFFLKLSLPFSIAFLLSIIPLNVYALVFIEKLNLLIFKKYISRFNGNGTLYIIYKFSGISLFLMWSIVSIVGGVLLYWYINPSLYG